MCLCGRHINGRSGRFADRPLRRGKQHAGGDCAPADIGRGRYNFLDAVRDLEVWKRTKEGASKMGGWTFGLLKDLGTAYLKHKAKDLLGLDL